MPEPRSRNRKRYIAFTVQAPRSISRGEFISAIKASVPNRGSWDRIKPWLTVFDENKGILRCTHTGCQEAVELLGSIKAIGADKMEIKVTTLTTSGTIKKAKARLGALFNGQ